MVRVALWHPRWTLLRASVCQRCGRCWGYATLPANLWVQKELYAELGPMKDRVDERAKTRVNLSRIARKDRPRLRKQQSPRINRQSGRRVEQREARARRESPRQDK